MCRSATATHPARRCPSSQGPTRRAADHARYALRRATSAREIMGRQIRGPVDIGTYAILNTAVVERQVAVDSHSRNPQVRAQAARITKSQADLERLCRDRVELVREACLENPYLDPPTLKLMARDPSTTMRRRVRRAMISAPGGGYAGYLARSEAEWDLAAVSLDTPGGDLRAWEDSFDPYVTVGAQCAAL